MIFSPPHLRDSARWSGLRIGLLGGSFNPPHEGHIHASLIALHSLKLDCVWWLVTPQNPLKPRAEMNFAQRFSDCRDLLGGEDPRIIATDIEARLGSSLTWQTIRSLRRRFPRTDFVWITGMDNALTMHGWHNWKDILEHVATAHVARPPAWSLIETCPLKMLCSQNHVYVDKACKPKLQPRRTYWLMQKKMVGISSTEIRNKNAISVR